MADAYEVKRVRKRYDPKLLTMKIEKLSKELEGYAVNQECLALEEM